MFPPLNSTVQQGAVSDEQIDHAWDIHVGPASEKYPLTASDIRGFARAVLALQAARATESAGFPLPNEEDVEGNLSYETRVKAARHDQLRAAAQAVIERWDDNLSSFNFIQSMEDRMRRLRLALDYDAAATAPAGKEAP